MEDVAHVRIARRSERDLKMRTIEVLIDGRHVADLQFGQEISITLEPGEHRLTVTNHLKTRSSDFQVTAGETVNFEVTGVLLGGLWALVSILGTIPYGVELRRT